MARDLLNRNHRVPVQLFAMAIAGLMLPIFWNTILAEESADAIPGVESAALDPALADQGWVLLRNKGVPTTSFVLTAAGDIRVVTDRSNGLIFREQVADVVAEDRLHWSWRVDKLSRDDLAAGSNPDWPLVVYAAFSVEPRHISFWRRMMNRIRFGFIGLPAAGNVLTYVWRGEKVGGDSPVRLYPNPYLPTTAMIYELRVGDIALGWQQESRNLLDDFQEAFGYPPDQLLYLAVSADSEDTNGTSTAYLRDLQLSVRQIDVN